MTAKERIRKLYEDQVELKKEAFDEIERISVTEKAIETIKGKAPKSVRTYNAIISIAYRMEARKLYCLNDILGSENDIYDAINNKVESLEKEINDLGNLINRLLKMEGKKVKGFRDCRCGILEAERDILVLDETVEYLKDLAYEIYVESLKEKEGEENGEN